jgi:hypothetical protein
VVLAHFFLPPREFRAQPLEDLLSDIQLDAVALAVVEADGLDERIALERPRKARGGVLPA